MTPPYQIIGVGSPFDGDNVAHSLINTLKPLLKEYNVQIAHCHYYDRPGLYLLEKINKNNPLIIIDAIMGGGKSPGEIYFFNELSSFYVDPSRLSSHAFGLAETLKLAVTLKCLPSEYYIFGIEIANASSERLLESSNGLALKICQFCLDRNARNKTIN